MKSVQSFNLLILFFCFRSTSVFSRLTQREHTGVQRKYKRPITELNSHQSRLKFSEAVVLNEINSQMTRIAVRSLLRKSRCIYMNNSVYVLKIRKKFSNIVQFAL